MQTLLARHVKFGEDYALPPKQLISCWWGWCSIQLWVTQVSECEITANDIWSRYEKQQNQYRNSLTREKTNSKYFTISFMYFHLFNSRSNNMFARHFLPFVFSLFFFVSVIKFGINNRNLKLKVISIQLHWRWVWI
jgi:hypothetical protein